MQSSETHCPALQPTLQMLETLHLYFFYFSGKIYTTCGDFKTEREKRDLARSVENDTR